MVLVLRRLFTDLLLSQEIVERANKNENRGIFNDPCSRARSPDLRREKKNVCRQTRGAFFWGYSGYSYSGLGITEYMEFQFPKERSFIRGTKRLVSVNICSVEGNSADIFVSKVSPGIFVIKEKSMPIIFGRIKMPFWVR